MHNVVTLPGIETISDEPSDIVVERLESLLADAKAGLIRGLFYVAYSGNQNDTFRDGRVTDDISRDILLYGVTMAAERLKRDCFNYYIGQD